MAGLSLELEVWKNFYELPTFCVQKLTPGYAGKNITRLLLVDVVIAVRHVWWNLLQRPSERRRFYLTHALYGQNSAKQPHRMFKTLMNLWDIYIIYEYIFMHMTYIYIYIICKYVLRQLVKARVLVSSIITGRRKDSRSPSPRSGACIGKAGIWGLRNSVIWSCFVIVWFEPQILPNKRKRVL